jgi:hypothetical protein
MIGKGSHPYIIELDGMSYEWIGQQLKPVSDQKSLQREGQKWLISDLEKGVSKTMTLEAPVKYVEVIARKTMEESGEFDEPVSIMTHWKKKADTNTTDVFFTALPVRQRQQYFARAEDQSDSVLVYPLYVILHGVLKRIRHAKPIAVVFQHDRFADIVIGTKDRVYYANRCVAFDKSEEQILSLWDMVKTDIESVEVDNKIEVDRVVLLNWIDSSHILERAKDIGKEPLPIGEERITIDGQVHHSSFLRALKMQSGFWSASSVYEKFLYYCQRLLPSLNAAMIVALLICAGGFFWFHHRADDLGNQLNMVQTEIRDLRKKTSQLTVSYKDVFSFVSDLERCRSVPAFKTIVNHISDALSQPMSLEILKADYGDNKVEIEVFGRAKTSFDQAYKGYQKFVTFLKQNGYTVSESNFDTELEESTFLAKLTKKI